MISIVGIGFVLFCGLMLLCLVAAFTKFGFWDVMKGLGVPRRRADSGDGALLFSVEDRDCSPQLVILISSIRCRLRKQQAGKWNGLLLPSTWKTNKTTGPSPESAAGEVVGGESRAWSSAFEEEHVADLYSSPHRRRSNQWRDNAVRF